MPDLSHHIHSVSGPNCNLCLYGTLHSRQFTGFTTCWSKSFTAPSAEDQDQAMVMTQLPGLADLLAKCQSSDAFIATCIIKKPLQDVHGRGLCLNGHAKFMGPLLIGPKTLTNEQTNKQQKLATLRAEFRATFMFNAAGLQPNCVDLFA